MSAKNWITGAVLGTAMTVLPATALADKPQAPSGLEMRANPAHVIKVPKKRIIRPKLDLALKQENSPKANDKPKEKKNIDILVKKYDKIELPPEKVIKYTVPWWQHLLQIPAAYVATVFLHESGHAVILKAYGYKNIKFHGPGDGAVASVSSLYPFQCHKFSPREKLTNRASMYYTNQGNYLCYKPTKRESTMTSLGGMGFTSIGNLLLTGWLKSDTVPKHLRSFIATTSLIMMFDRYRYVLSSALKFAFRKKMDPSDDVHSIISTNHGSRKTQGIAYGLWTAATALEIGLRANEIKYLLYTALGRKESYKRDTIYLRATPTALGDGATINLSGTFDENKLLK